MRRGLFNRTYAEAVKCYRKAAEQGNAIPSHREARRRNSGLKGYRTASLGFRYERGQGVSQDFSPICGLAWRPQKATPARTSATN
jgi:TPR repeat protein